MSWNSDTLEGRVRELERDLGEFKEVVVISNYAPSINATANDGRGAGSTSAVVGPIKYPWAFTFIDHRRYDAEAPPYGGSNVDNTIFVISTSVRVTPQIAENPINIRTIAGAGHNGQIMFITVKSGTMNLLQPSGGQGNINITADINGLTKDNILLLQWNTNAPLATSTSGSWNVISGTTGGGGGGGEVFTWTGNHSASNFDLTNIGKLIFNVTSGVSQIIENSNDGKTLNIQTNNVNRMNISHSATLQGIVEVFGQGGIGGILGQSDVQIKTVSQKTASIVDSNIGEFVFDGKDDGGNQVSYGGLFCDSTAITAGTYRGTIKFGVANGTGSMSVVMNIGSEGIISGVKHQFFTGAEMVSGSLNMLGNNIINIEQAKFTSVRYIQNDNTLGGIDYIVPLADDHFFFVGASKVMQLGSVIDCFENIDLQGTREITKATAIRFGATGTSGNITNFPTSNDLAYFSNSGASGTHQFYTQVVKRFDITQTLNTSYLDFRVKRAVSVGEQLTIAINGSDEVEFTTGSTIMKYNVGGIVRGQLEGLIDTKYSIITSGNGIPSLSLFRNDSTPIDADTMGRITFDGNDSSLTKTTYAEIVGVGLDITNGTEDGRILFNTVVAGSGSLLNQMTIADGVAVSNSFLTAGNTTQITTTTNTISGTSTTISSSSIFSVTSPSILIGDSTSDVVSIVARVNTTFEPSTTLTRDLGTSSLLWNNLYVGTINAGSIIKSNTSTEIGIYVNNTTGTVGTAGTLRPPYIVDATVYSSGVSATLDGFFGNVDGCMGLQYQSGTNVFWFRLNGSWRKSFVT